MGGLIPVIHSNIDISKMEEKIVAPSKPLFYKRYVDDTYVRRKKNETDELYNALNSYHQNVKLTLDLDPTLIQRLFEVVAKLQLTSTVN